MADASLRAGAPRDWNAAFAAVPLEPAPADGWARVAAALEPSRRRHGPLWLAAAAALLLAVVLPWRLSPGPGADGNATPADKATVPADPIAALHVESAQLEGLLALARDDRVASAAAAVLGEQLDTRIVSIDSALREPGLSRGQQLSLWRERVDVLRSAVGFQSTRRWLAAQGERYDGAVVQID